MQQKAAVSLLDFFASVVLVTDRAQLHHHVTGAVLVRNAMKYWN